MTEDNPDCRIEFRDLFQGKVDKNEQSADKTVWSPDKANIHVDRAVNLPGFSLVW
jgi:hypothetical protein